MVRVKLLGSFGRPTPAGVVTISVRSVSELGVPESRAWFPLSPYEKMKEAQGDICLGIYWTKDPVEELMSPQVYESNSSPGDISPKLPVSPSGRSRKSSRSSRSGMAFPIPSMTSPPTISRLKHVLGITHKTQEEIIRSGASSQGLTLQAEGVQIEGEWRNVPLRDIDMEEDKARDVMVYETTDTAFAANRTRNLVISTNEEGLEQDEPQNSDHFILKPRSMVGSDVTSRSSLELRENLAVPPPQIAESRRPVLMLEIIEGRGLLAADANGLSDPYCIIKFKNAKRKTKIISRSLTPHWGETIIFGGDDHPKELVSLDDLVTIIVKDHDIVGFDDDLGRVDLPLWAIVSHHHGEDDDEDELDEAMTYKSSQKSVSRQLGTVEQSDSSDEENSDDESPSLPSPPHLGPKGKSGLRLSRVPKTGKQLHEDGGVSDEELSGDEEEDNVSDEEDMDAFDTGRFDVTGEPLQSSEFKRPESPRSVLSSGSTKSERSFVSHRSTRSLFNLNPTRNKVDMSDTGSATPPRPPHARFRRFQSINAHVVNTKPKWYSLHCSPGMTTVRGEIKVRISYFGGTADGDTLNEFARISRLPTRDTNIKGSVRHLLSRDSQFEESFDQCNKEKPSQYSSVQTLLHIRVIQARNILAADANGKSDPYAIVSVRDSSRRTPIMRRTLNPVWNVQFEFGKSREVLTELDEIRISLKDHDRITRDDDLGFLIIPIWSIIGSESGAVWYSLKHKSCIPRYNKANDTIQIKVKDKAPQNLGEIQLQISYIVTNLAVERPLGVPGLDPKGVPLLTETTTRDVLDTVARAKQAQYKLYNGKIWFFKMNVTVIGATDLPVTDDRGTSTTFATITCAKETKKTKTVKGTSNPTYKDRFEFSESSIPGALGVSRQDRILVTIRSPSSSSSAEKERCAAQEGGKDKIGGQIIAVTTIDVGFLIDKMGYIDRDGMQVHGSFDLETLDHVPMGPMEDIRRVLIKGTSSETPQQSETKKPQGKPRVRLAIELHPKAESRLMSQEKLIVRVNRAKGLDESSRQKTQRNIFVRAVVGPNQLETSVSKMIHGHVVVHEDLYFSDLDAEELCEMLHIFVCLEDTGEPIAHFSYPLEEVRKESGTAIQGWFMLDFISDEYVSSMLQRPKVHSETGGRDNFARLSVDQAEIHLSVRLVNVMEFIKPTLGYVEMNLLKLKMDTNDFNYNLRCVIKHKGKQMLTQTFPGVVNVIFDPDDCYFRFPVRDMFAPITIEVWNVPLPSLGLGGKTLKLMGSATVGLNDLIELEACTVFNHPHLGEPARLEPIKLVIKDSRDKKQGSLRLAMHFQENLMGGSLATHANPSRHKEKPFSVSNLRHEVQRTIALFNSFTSIFGAINFVLNWKHAPTSAMCLMILVLACVLDFWTSRILAVFPFVALVFIIHRHTDRTYGRFASKLLQKSGVGEKDTKARLLVTVIAGRNLIAMDDNGKSDPLVNISVMKSVAGKPIERKLGRTRTIYKTLNPDWGASIIGFKANVGSSLIQWRSSRDGTRVPAVETFINRDVLQQPELVVRVVGTRGIARGYLPEPHFSGDRSFQVTMRVVPMSLLQEHRQNIRSKSLESPTSPLSFGNYGWHHHRQRRRSSISSVRSEETDTQEFTDDNNDMIANVPSLYRRSSSSSTDAASGGMSMSSASTMGAAYDLYRNVSIDETPSNADVAEKGWLPNYQKENERSDAEIQHVLKETVLTPLEKKLLHDIIAHQEGNLSRECSTSPVRAFLNPKWNERMRIGQEFVIDCGDIAVLTVKTSSAPDRPKASGMEDVAYAFIPLKALENAGNDLNHWFKLENLEDDEISHHQHAEQQSLHADSVGDMGFDQGQDSALTRWTHVGDILLSVSLRGVQQTPRDPKLGTEGLTGSWSKRAAPFPAQKKVVRRASEDDGIIKVTTGTDRVFSAEPWSGVQTTLVFDVFDEDNYTHRDFIGRARIPLSSLVADDSANEQPILEKWVPLGLRFDSSKADRQLWSCAQGRRYPTSSSTTFSRAIKAGSRASSRVNRSSLTSGLLKAPLTRLRMTLNARKASADSEDSVERARMNSMESNTSLTESDDEISRIDSGTSVIENREPQRMTRENTDLNFQWQQRGAPFGEILIRAQLMLPDPGAEEAYQAAEEAKKADKGGIIEQSRVVFKNLQIFQNYLFGINNSLEQFRNLFNWTHPRKTHFLMKLMLGLFLLLVLVPSRFIILFLGIFLFTERFRPLGIFVIKFKHMAALVPTNDDLVELYTKGPLLGALGYSKGGSANDYLPENERSESSEISKISGSRFYQGMRDRYLAFGGLRNQVMQTRSREAQESKLIISESDCKAYGHLRLLQRGRSKQWRRYYFAIAHHQLMFWIDKDDMLVRVAQGGFGELLEVSSVLPNSRDAQFLARKGIVGGTLDCTFVIEHPERYKLRSDDLQDSSAQESSEDDIISTTSRALSELTQNQLGKRIRTYLVANNIAKKEYWIQNLQRYCLQNPNMTKSKIAGML